MSPHIRAHLSKYLVALSLVIVAVFAVACVTAEDTQKTADAHQTFEMKREDVTTRLAAGEITSEQAVAELQAAVNELKAKLVEIGKGVSERTRGFFESPESWLGSALVTLLGTLGHGVVRSSREVKRWGTPEEAEAELEALKAEILALKSNSAGRVLAPTSPAGA